MYENYQRDSVSAYHNRRHSSWPATYARLIVTVLVVACSIRVQAQNLQSTPVIRKIGSTTEKLELTTNTSRILTLDKNIPRVQVNNPDLLAVTPLSATQVQVSAKKAGVTQVNLWDDEGKVHAVDVLIYGDARELEVALQTQFPHASIKVFRYSESLVLTGFVDRPDHVSPIMQLAADYSPKVINNISVGGVQQVLLKVKVMEVSRTKLRQLGVDWAWFGGGNGSFALNKASGLIRTFDSSAKTIETANETFDFGIIGDNAGFFGVLDALQNRQCAKILADPTIVAVSGRPAQFQVGGEVPIVVPQSLGTSSIEFKSFGTQVDFLPIVLGNGNIRLEVRPRISFLDPANGITLNSILVPGFNVRQVDTAVEMKAGQTFALAGLVQERTETRNRGLPYLSDVPILGVPFRRTRDEVNEIELLIVITPEFVDPIDACEAPCGGPGYATVTPTNKQLYCAGHVEVHPWCNPTNGVNSCGQDPCGRCNNGCQCNGAPVMNGGMSVQGMPAQNSMPMHATPMPGGSGYDDSVNEAAILPTPESDSAENSATLPETTLVSPAPEDLSLPGDTQTPAEETRAAAESPIPPQPAAPAPLPKPAQSPPATPAPSPTPTSGSYYPWTQPDDANSVLRRSPDPAWNGPAQRPAYSNSHSYIPQRQPVFVRNASRPNNPQSEQSRPTAPARENSLIGPIGYEQ